MSPPPGTDPMRQRHGSRGGGRGQAGRHQPERYSAGGHDGTDGYGTDGYDSGYGAGGYGGAQGGGPDAGYGGGGWGGEPGDGASFVPGLGGSESAGGRNARNARVPRAAKAAKAAKNKRGPVRRLAPWIATALVLVVIGVPAYYAYTLYMSKYHPADYTGSGAGPAVTVQVKQNDTATSLAPELARLGVVASPRAFVLAAEHAANTAGLEPGTYRLDRHMKASIAYADLLNPKNRVQLTVTVPEGERAAQVIATLSRDMNVPVATFQSILKNPGRLGLPSYAKGKPEGYLWPATYEIQPKEKPLKVLRAMVAKFGQVSAQENLPAGAARRGVSMEQLMIEASIVQAEGNRADELPKIARVIVNRLNASMPLQFDSVLEYGLNRFAVNIQDSWARIPGPYNDFQNKGLPPTPICSPGLDAINAVLHPAKGNWLYFLAFPNGKSEFSATPLKGMS